METRAPFVTYLLAGSLFAVAYGITGFFPRPDTILQYAWGTDAYHHGEWPRLLTAMWVHAGLIHLITNAIALLSFGPAVERKLGHTGFLLLYLGAGIAGNLAHVASGANLPVVGASGAVFGVLGALLILNPLAQVAILTLIPMPLLLASALYVAAVPFLQDLSATLPIAHAAHLGGLAAGLGAAAAWAPRRAWRILPLAAVVFAAVWVAVGYAATLPLMDLIDAGWEDATRELWPLAAMALVAITALWGIGRVERHDDA